MKISLRWYNTEDDIPLKYIKQIPGVKGIVSAIYDVPEGEVWPKDKIKDLINKVESAGMELTAIESLPVHEDIKMGKPSRDKYIENYNKSLENLGDLGIKVVTYNFMPVFDWTRSELNFELEDGSKALIYEGDKVKNMNPLDGTTDLPGLDQDADVPEWDDNKSALIEKMKFYQDISEEDLWENLAYFLKGIVKTAEANDIKLAIHPDDPPWSIFGLPRIITGKESYRKMFELVPSPANGLALCTGSLGADPDNNLPELIREFGDRIHFAHIRNIKHIEDKSFRESAHPSEYGSLDIYEVMKAYHEIGFEGPMRPDHGRMIWGETGKAGYGLYDRALGANYLYGLWEAINKSNN